MMKNLLLTLAIIPGIVVIFIVSIANRLTSGLDTESIEIFLKYLTEFDKMKGIQEVVGSDAGLIVILHKLSEHSHWIITASIIWIVVLIYIIGSNRRSKNGKQKQKV